MKAILLAGGNGTRLYPATLGISKQLLYIAGKPMFYYPLSLIMQAGCREILIISTPKDIPVFQELLGDGKQLGLSISYAIQPSPDGLAQAFTIGKGFIGKDNVMLMLGDNIFYGAGLGQLLQDSVADIDQHSGGRIFAYRVADPERYGSVIFDKDGKVVDLIEKDPTGRSKYAIPGIYFYDNDVIEIAENLTPSARGELEITDVNKVYLQREKLRVTVMQRGMAWLDSGTAEAMNDAQNFIYPIERRQGIKVGCLEEVAWRMGFISSRELAELIQSYRAKKWKNEYVEYLEQLLEEGDL